MEEAKRSRRRHSAEFKQQVLAECTQPVASVAAVALARGLTDNLVRKWRRQARVGDLAQGDGDTFIPVTLSSAAPATAMLPAVIDVEVRRGTVSVLIRWPASAAAVCAAWLRARLA